MRFVTVIILCSLFLGVSGDGLFSFFKEAIQGKKSGGRQAV